MRALRDRAPDEGTLGRPPELVADEARDAGCAAAAAAIARACAGIERERLLAHDVLARGDRVERQHGVRVPEGLRCVTASTSGNANASSADSECRHAEAFGTARGPLRVAPDQRDEPSNPAARNAGTWTRAPKPVPTTTMPGPALQ